MYLQYTVKVVLSIGIIGVCNGGFLRAQSFIAEAVTSKVTSFYCQRASLEEVLRQLERETGIHFVYSPSVIAADTKITLSLSRKNLQDIFEAISAQANVTFKIQNGYAVVKNKVLVNNETRLHTASNQIQVKNPLIWDQAINSFDDAHNDPTDNSNNGRELSIVAMPLKDVRWVQDDCFSYDTALMQTYQQSLIKSLNRYETINRRWLASVSFFTSDVAISNLEVRLGVKRLYAIANAGLLTNDIYRIGYGVGTSIPVSQKISIYPSYTYAAINYTVDYTFEGRNITIVKTDRVSVYHHQLKLVGQYLLPYNFSLQAGITGNYLASMQKPESLNLPHLINNVDTRPVYNSGDEYPTIVPPGSHYISTEKFWIGFEAGVNYRFQFKTKR